MRTARLATASAFRAARRLARGILVGMPTVEISDETLVIVDRVAIATVVSDPVRWTQWWPDCDVTVILDRGVDGMRWSVRGALVGYSEVRLLARPDGVVIHYLLTADPTVPGSRTQPRIIPDSPRGRRELQELRRRQLMAWKSTVWAMMETLGATAPSE